MSTKPENPESGSEDQRWDGRVPWSLRYQSSLISGDVDTWLLHIGQRLERFVVFNEPGFSNYDYLGSCLESESLSAFKHKYGSPVGAELKEYLSPNALKQQAELDCLGDSEHLRAIELAQAEALSNFGGLLGRSVDVPKPEEVLRAQLLAQSSRERRLQGHWNARLRQRMTTIESFFRTVINLTEGRQALDALVRDIGRICAATHVPLDIRGNPPLIVPIEELLLQREVIYPLLDRLQERWPDRARELTTAYHNMLTGKLADEVFGDAFKTVEEIGRAITDNTKFQLCDKDVRRHFPTLHPTIVYTIDKLRAHRGDEAGHGRNAPEPNEIRYLLFQLCNTALLLLDSEPTIVR